MSMRLRVALTGLAFATSSALAESNTPAPAIGSDPNFIAAKKAIDAKQWDKALYSLKYVKAEDPEVYNLTDYASRKVGKMDDAFRNYKIALQMNPNHRGAHEYVGEAYLITNNLAMAEQHLAALEKICGKNCEEYRDLAKEIAEYKQKH